MRFDNVHILGVSAEYGQLVPAVQATATGEYGMEEAQGNGYVSVSVSDQAAPDLAVAAGRRALDAAGLREPGQVRKSIGIHLHACCYHQGIDLWPASCYILDQLGGGGAALTCQVGALSNGGMAAFDLAASMLSGRPDIESALVTSGDRFCEPGFHRWAHDPTAVWGDAGAAIVLGRRPGIAQLISCASQVDPGMEGMVRGDAPFEPASTLLTTSAALGERRHQFVKRIGGMGALAERSMLGTQHAVDQVLHEADLKLDDMRWVLTPFFGLASTRRRYLEPLGIGLERTVVEFGLTVGHLGASDAIAGLAHLTGDGLAKPGDYVLLLGMGGGTVWTPAIVQITA